MERSFCLPLFPVNSTTSFCLASTVCPEFSIFSFRFFGKLGRTVMFILVQTQKTMGYRWLCISALLTVVIWCSKGANVDVDRGLFLASSKLRAAFWIQQSSQVYICMPNLHLEKRGERKEEEALCLKTWKGFGRWEWRKYRGKCGIWFLDAVGETDISEPHESRN